MEFFTIGIEIPSAIGIGITVIAEIGIHQIVFKSEEVVEMPDNIPRRRERGCLINRSEGFVTRHINVFCLWPRESI